VFSGYLKTRTDNRPLLGRYLIFKNNCWFRLFSTPQRTAGLRGEPSFPVISNPLKKALGFRKELAIFWAVI
jgi:hypothetical protein